MRWAAWSRRSTTDARTLRATFVCIAAPPTSDESLYTAWAGGDRRAGTILVERYLRPIGRFFANKLIDGDDVEDSTSRVFEICARNLGTFRGEGTFRAYLFGVAYNVMREGWRRRLVVPLDLEASAVRDLGPSPASIAVARAQERLLLEALRAIPVEYQTVVELAHFEGLSRAEIAIATGVPEGTVASRLRRAQVLLEARIAELASSPELARTTQADLWQWAAGLRAILGREPS